MHFEIRGSSFGGKCGGFKLIRSVNYEESAEGVRDFKYITIEIDLTIIATANA